VNKQTIINHLTEMPCKDGCYACALRFTHLCVDSELHKMRREKVKANIISNTRGLDFISMERCQITVLKEELQTIRNE